MKIKKYVMFVSLCSTLGICFEISKGLYFSKSNKVLEDNNQLPVPMKAFNQGADSNIGYNIFLAIIITLNIFLFALQIFQWYRLKIKRRSSFMNIVFENVSDIFIACDSKTKKIEFVSNNLENVLRLKNLDYKDIKEKMLNDDLYHRIERFALKNNLSTTNGLEVEYVNPLNNEKICLLIKIYQIFDELRNQLDVIVIHDNKSLVHKDALVVNALKASREVSLAKGEFMSKTAHELRTPLNGIVGMLEIIKRNKQELDYEIASSINNIEGSANYLMSIINNILDITKIESNKMEINKEKFNGEEFIDYLDSLISIQAKSKQIRFEVAGDLNISKYFFTDKYKLSQILINLLTNSIKFTDENGHVRLDFIQQRLDSENQLVSFIISDDGFGMSKNFRDGIYSSFSQESKTTSQLFGGSGLGLSICNKLVELINGSLLVSSKEGFGSKFVFQVKMPLVHDLKLDLSSEDIPMDFQGLKIMLVEDNHINQQVAKTLLNSFNVECLVCENGLEAVKTFENSLEFEYDIIFMDVHMPLLNGYRATEQIRMLSRKDAKQIRIIAMTADAFVNDIKKAIDCGMDDHLSKPIKRSELAKNLSRYCENLKSIEKY